MKFIIFVSLFIISAMSGIDATVKNDLQEANVKGKVKSIQQVRTSFSVSIIYGDTTIKPTVYLDSDETFTKHYNESGNTAEKITYNSDSSQNMRSVYLYNADKQLTEIKTYDSKGKISDRSVAKYNKAGVRTGYIAHADQKDKYMRFAWRYNEKGQRTTQILYDHSKSGIFGYKYTYDDKGNRIQVTVHDPEFKELYQRNDFTFDPNGNKVTETIYGDGEKINKKVYYAYDKSNNLISEITESMDLKTTHKVTLKYTYDETGNWIRKIVIKDGMHDEMIERKITYYPS